MKKFLLIIMSTLMSILANAQVITSQDILKSYENATQDVNSEYCYNADFSEGRICTQYVYRKVADDASANQLIPHLQYRFEYDSADRLTSRTKLRWNSAAMDWVEDSRTDYTYMTDTYTVEQRKWDEGNGKFGRPSPKMTYNILPEQPLAVNQQ